MAALGLQLLWSNVSENLTCKEDAAVAIIHWILLKNALKCTGIKDNDNEGNGSELLPDGWNSDKEVYSLFYTDGKNRYQVKILKAGNLLLVNAVNIKTEVVGSVGVNCDKIAENFKDFSNDLYDSLDKLIKDIEQVVDSIKPKSETKKKTDEKMQPVPNPLDSRLFQPRFPAMPMFNDPLAVGSSDLDPLGRGNAGMLMDPRRFRHNVNRPRQGDFPRGPPGSRFDPIGPFPDLENRPGRRPFSGPDPDHLPPPGYDDMFM